MYEVRLLPSAFPQIDRVLGFVPAYIATDVIEWTDQDDYYLVARKNGALSFIHKGAVMSVRKTGEVR